MTAMMMPPAIVMSTSAAPSVVMAASAAVSPDLDERVILLHGQWRDSKSCRSRIAQGQHHRGCGGDNQRQTIHGVLQQRACARWTQCRASRIVPYQLGQVLLDAKKPFLKPNGSFLAPEDCSFLDPNMS